MLKLIVLVCVSFSLYSKEVITGYHFVTAEIMPVGVFTFGYNKSLSTQITNRINGDSREVTQQNHLSRNLSFQDISDGAKDRTDKVLSASAFKAYGIGLNESAGQIKNNLNINMESNVFILGYGLSKKSNLFLIIPQVKVTNNISSRFNTTATFNDFVNELRTTGQNSRADYLEKLKANPLETRLEESGMRIPGEIDTVANVFLDYKRSFGSVISDTTLVIPYGYKYSTDDFIDYKINEMSLGLKQTVAKRFNIAPKHEFSIIGGYHLRTPFQMDYRIPQQRGDPLSGQKESNVEIKYGDEFELSTQYLFKISSSFSPYVNLRYNESYKDSYSGNKFKSEKYSYLEDDTDSAALSMGLGFSINTISSFIKNKFFMPLDLNLNYAQTLIGRNTFMAKSISFNFMGFYK